MARQKPVCIALDDETLEILDACAVNKGVSRSIVLRQLIHGFVVEKDIFPAIVPPGLKQRIIDGAEKKGRKVEEYIEKMLDKIVVDEDEFMPVVLKIPKNLKHDSSKLKEWLDSRVSMLMGYFCGGIS